MKLGENDYVIRQSFSLSLMSIGQRLWIFHQWPIFQCVPFFLTQTLFQFGHGYDHAQCQFLNKFGLFGSVLGAAGTAGIAGGCSCPFLRFSFPPGTKEKAAAVAGGVV